MNNYNSELCDNNQHECISIQQDKFFVDSNHSQNSLKSKDQIYESNQQLFTIQIENEFATHPVFEKSIEPVSKNFGYYETLQIMEN